MIKATICAAAALLVVAGLSHAQDRPAFPLVATIDTGDGTDAVPPVKPLPAGSVLPAPAVFPPGVVNGTGTGPGVSMVWAGFDYLNWWFKDAPVNVPLVTTGSIADAVPAALGQPHTGVLFGGQPFSTPVHSGYRVTFGGWLDQDATIGAEASGFYFQPQNHTAYTTGSATNGLPILGVPFFNIAPAGPAFNAGGWTGTGPPGTENAVLAADGTTRFGSISVSSASQLWGVEGNVLFNLTRSATSQVIGLVGVRYVNLQESLDTAFVSDSTGPASQQFFRLVNINDHFGTRNQFYGGQVGLRGQWNRGWLYAMVQGKIGLGDMHETLIINGQFADALPKLYNNFGNGPGGIFAQPSNIGHYHQDRFAVLPSGEARIGVNILPTFRIYVGYEILYMSSVVRPGDQIDRVVNTMQVGPAPGGIAPTLTGPARPAPQFNTTDFWAQGINFGLQFHY